MPAKNDENISGLVATLNHVGPGPIVDADDLAFALGKCWHMLTGSETTKMAAFKLTRIEEVEWLPPILSFTIERHGSIALGSTRAELQSWKVDLDKMTTTPSIGGRYRRVRPTAAAVRRSEMTNDAEELAAIMQHFQPDSRLVWKDLDTVCIKVGEIIPNDCVRQTLVGRRKRFRNILRDVLGREGWKESTKPYQFKRVTNGDDSGA